MSTSADLVLKNGLICTIDGAHPRAKALAIRGTEIVAVGSDAEMDAFTNSTTRVKDLQGKLVLPGFNDAHTHFIWAAIRDATTLSLYGVTSMDEVEKKLRNFSQNNPDQDWLLGRRWDLSRFEDGVYPSREDLDAVESRRPVAITDMDGHSAWVNSRALDEMGYGASTPQPAGGRILKDGNGRPTGILLETAMDPLPVINLPDQESFAKIICQAALSMNQLGITSLSNNGISPDNLETLIKLSESGEFTLRISEWPRLDEDLSTAISVRDRLAENEIIHVVGLKAMIDGVLSSRTAWMLEPYGDAPGNSGFPMTEPEHLLGLAKDADAHGFQVITHAIGDRAVRETLDIYEKIADINGKRDSRHRVEHVEVAHPRDQDRFVKLGVLPCMQPVHCTACVDDYVIDRLGEERGGQAYAWKNFVKMDAHLCFGTDWPAVDLAAPSPLESIYGAVTRKYPGKPREHTWHPEQRLSVEEAIRCYTIESAYAEFMEHRKGSITPGKLADLCVIDRNILQEPPDALLETQVVMTVFNGKIVFEDNR
jgi:predicted amidohydrolase YtcJ